MNSTLIQSQEVIKTFSAINSAIIYIYTLGSALQNLACGIWWKYLQRLQEEAEKSPEEQFNAKELPPELLEDYNQILPLFKRAIKSYESKYC